MSGKSISIDVILNQIDDCLISGDFHQAEILLESVLELNRLKVQQRKSIERRWIRLDFAKGNIEAVLRKLKQYIHNHKIKKGSTEWFEIYCLKAVINASSGHQKESGKILTKLTKHLDSLESGESGQEWVLVNIGCMLRDQGQWQDGLDCLLGAYHSAGKKSEIGMHAALVIAQMLSDLDCPGVDKWTSIVIQSASKWGAWEQLKIAEILAALDRFRNTASGQAINDLHRHLNEADQLDRVQPRMRARLALAEAMIYLGDYDSGQKYLLRLKDILENGGTSLAKHSQPIAELLILKIICKTAVSDQLWEAIDRVEILLAVMAKYSRPPGPAPFWLMLARLQSKIGRIDNAVKAFKRACSEAEEAGSFRRYCDAALGLAQLEWNNLKSEDKFHSVDKNRILALTADALNKAVQSKDLDIEWRIHHFRGSMFAFSNEQYPAENEMATAAKTASLLLHNIHDPGLKKIYADKQGIKKALDELQPYISEDTDVKVDQPISPPEEKRSVDLVEKENIQNLHTVLKALYSIYSAGTHPELISKSLQNIILAFNADQIQFQLSNSLDGDQQVYSKTCSQIKTGRHFSVPEKWIMDTRSSGQSAIFTRSPDEENSIKRTVMCAPIIHKKAFYGIVYIDRAYRDKPFENTDLELLDTIIHAVSVTFSTLSMRKRLGELTEQFRKEIVPQFPDIIGVSEPMKEIFLLIDKVARAEVPALITGETGTGKDLIAKTIHNISHRKDHPFVYLDCSSIPPTLLESELFGIEKGVATGVDPRIGLLEYADGGTVLLDEIGDIPLTVQAKLLRVLQEREFEPVGSDKLVSVDIRILSTTSTDLKKAIRNQTIRDDFFYRIAGIRIDLPPLRDRMGDIILLARTFLQRYNAEFNKNIAGFTPDALDAMDTYKWSGNVRELDHVIRKAVLFCQGERISLPEIGLPSPKKEGMNLNEAIREFEKQAVHEAIAVAGNDIEKAAKALQIPTAAVKRLMKK